MKYRKNKNKKNYQEGIALVEVIAALGVAAIAITALVSLSISTLRTSLDSKLLLEGTKIANREIEMVRAYRDGEDGGVPRSWESFIGVMDGCVNSPCYMDEYGDVVYDEKIQNDGKADEIRWSFTVSDPDNPGGPITVDNSIVRISVSVNWTIGDQQKGAYVYTDLSNWRGR